MMHNPQCPWMTGGPCTCDFRYQPDPQARCPDCGHPPGIHAHDCHRPDPQGIEYGTVDIPPEAFDPKNGFIRLDIYDRVKAERDLFGESWKLCRADLAQAEADNARLREALEEIGRWKYDCLCHETAREALQDERDTRRATCPECEGNGCPICAKGKP